MMVAEWGEEGLREKLKYSTSLLAAASSCFVRHAWVLHRDIITRYTYYLQGRYRKSVIPGNKLR